MDCAIGVFLADEQAFLAHRSFAVTLFYLVWCSSTKDILFLGFYYFDSSRRVSLGFVARRSSVWYTLRTDLSESNSMYQDQWIVVFGDRI